jgi:hypothetical protein
MPKTAKMQEKEESISKKEKEGRKLSLHMS